MNTTLRIAGIEGESFVDGPGIRLALFVQGCPHHCPGCHNPGTHDFNGGTLIESDEILKMLEENPLISGVTFSGGEPFSQSKALAELGKEVKKRGFHLMIYTGFIYENLLNKAEREPEILDLLKCADILVDGPFILEQKSLELRFRGSKNQRIIDVQKSLKEKRVVEYDI